MIAVDTNILVRYAVKDDSRQTAISTNFLATHQCFVLKTVLIELVWVLESNSGYALPRNIVEERLRHISGLPDIVVQDSYQVALALDWYSSGMDFADALHLASSLDLKGFATFDRRISDKAKQMNITHPVILLS